MATKKGLKIAVEGCCHGELDKIYQTLQQLERSQGVKVDLLICCGDFQATRNFDDLETMSCPPKYRHLRSFYKYYSGEAVAPYPTIFVGGNHEAANYLWELYHGGWVAPNIFFLGYAGVVRFGNLRIGGLSGIYAEHHYKLGHHEAPPYTPKTIKSAYHVRELEVFRLKQLREPLDIFVSHDWPCGIYNHGDKAELLKKKPYFRKEVERNELGSPAAAELLAHLQPDYWFSGHLHVKHAALVPHPPGPNGEDGKKTRFLALDKCLPGRDFLQVINFPDGLGRGKPQLHYDPEWLAVLRCTHDLFTTSFRAKPLVAPPPGQVDAEKEKMKALLDERGSRVPENFCRTAPALKKGSSARRGRMPTEALRNPQTVQFLDTIGLPYNFGPEPSQAAAVPSANPEEIDLGEDMPSPEANPEEIDLGDEPPSTEANPEEIDLGEDEDALAAATYTNDNAETRQGEEKPGGGHGDGSDGLFEPVEIHGSFVIGKEDSGGRSG